MHPAHLSSFCTPLKFFLMFNQRITGVISFLLIFGVAPAYADYEIPALDTYMCSRDGINTGPWLNAQEAADAWGRQVSQSFPQFTTWWIQEVGTHVYCKADNGLYAPGVSSPPYDGIDGFLDKIPGCQYRTTNGTVTIGTLGAYNTTDGSSRYVCQIASSVDPKNCDSCELLIGNPIQIGTGNKYLKEVDTEVGSLRFSRHYNSGSLPIDRSIGIKWKHNYNRTIKVKEDKFVPWTAQLYRENGSILKFTLQTGNWVADADNSNILIEEKDGSQMRIGWKYSVENDSVEKYDVNGRLLSILHRNGRSETLGYDNKGRLSTITDSFDRSLTLTYDSYDRIALLVDPSGNNYVYAYDVNSNLSSVTYPDGKKRIYWYNEQDKTSGANLPFALTGITDENGVRFATYVYNAAGQALSTEHAGGVEKYSVTYLSANSRSNVVDPKGNARTYDFQTILGAIKSTSISQPAGSGSSAASNSITYDANGNIASRTDVNGVKTTYVYDLSRNLETSRTEAAGTAQVRTISTQWHPTYHLPAKIAEPYKLTTFAYDASGNLLSKTEQATGDASGAQGVAATTTEPSSTWRYTYNSVGQVLTARSPRTDIDDTTSYSYDSQGNLVSVIDAQGHVTVLSQYDAHGRAGRIADANGVVTTLAYDARGRLVSKTMGGETTRYDYDGVGQLTQVMLVDGGRIAYIYDDAHRLTGMADGAGNAIRYTLDAMGNRVREEVKDEEGILKRQITRAYDALARPQQVTGGRE